MKRLKIQTIRRKFLNMGLPISESHHNDVTTDRQRKHEIKHSLRGLSDDSDFDIGAWPIGIQHVIT
jgi:hypothetical protein